MDSSANNASLSDSEKALFIATRSEQGHLLLVSEQLFDIDIQPAAEDFSIQSNGQNIAVKAVQLSSTTEESSYPTVICMLLGRALPAAAELTIRYKPIDFLMWSQSNEQAVEAFTLTTIALPPHELGEIRYQLPEFEDFSSDSEDGSPDITGDHTSAADSSNEIFEGNLQTNFKAELDEEYIFNTDIQDIPADYKALSTFDKYVADLLDIGPVDSDSSKKIPETPLSKQSAELESPPVEQIASETVTKKNSDTSTSHDRDFSAIELIAPEGVTKTEDHSVPENITHQIEKTPEEKPSYLERTLTILMLSVAFAVGVILLFLVYFFIQFLSGDFASPEKENTANSEINIGATPSNHCTVKYPNGRYEGECIDGKGEGKGDFYWDSGDHYQGDWSNKNKQGEGILTYQNGDIFEGQFENDLKHGYGTMQWFSGAKYQGEYQYGKFHGQGTYWTRKGDRYEGIFHNGRFTKKGTCYHRDGSSYVGPCKP